MEEQGFNKKRPREEVEDEAIAEEKRARVENRAQQQREVRKASTNCSHLVGDRQLSNKMRMPPNIFRGYHLQTFDIRMGHIKWMVMAGDIICLIHINDKVTSIVPFKRQVSNQISVCTDDDKKPIITQLPLELCVPYYNPYTNSLILVEVQLEPLANFFISIEITSIEAGLTATPKQLFQGESTINSWEFDIPNCRFVIYKKQERVFKFFELKEYSQLFTIPEPGSSLQYQIQEAALNDDHLTNAPILEFGSPGSTDMVIHQKVYKESTLFRIYSKLNGNLRKQFSLPLHLHDANSCARFAVVCGSDRMVVQMTCCDKLEVIDISCEDPVVIKKTNISTAFEPYYLHKTSKFICYDDVKETVEVCNLDGDILATLQNHQLFWPESFSSSHITKSEDIIISVCGVEEDRYRYSHSINVGSIITGKCLASIGVDDISNCSEIRKAALQHRNEGFAYDERTHQILTANKRGVCCVWSNRFLNDVGGIDNYPESSDSEDEISDDSSDEESEIQEED